MRTNMPSEDLNEQLLAKGCTPPPTDILTKIVNAIQALRTIVDQELVKIAQLYKVDIAIVKAIVEILRTGGALSV